MSATITERQFAALAELLRLRNGPTRVVIRAVMVEGQAVADAARAAPMDYRAASYAVKRARKGLDLAREAVGPP